VSKRLLILPGVEDNWRMVEMWGHTWETREKAEKIKKTNLNL
jgi:hypothetical protein